MNNRKIRVSTLDDGNNLTCSYYAASQLGFKKILPSKTFEDGILSLKKGKADIVFVPGAYPGVNQFIMDKDIVVCKTFVHPIPPLLLTGFSLHPPEIASLIIHHPATTPLLPETGVIFKDTMKVTSNAVACIKLIEQGQFDSLAITNKLCADYFKLKIIKMLRRNDSLPHSISDDMVVQFTLLF